MKHNRFIRRILPLALVVFASALAFGCGGYRSISVASVTGEAVVSRAGQAGSISCYEGMKLQDQDVLTVADDGGIVLKLDDDKYAYLEPNAKIRISATGKTGNTNTNIELLSGTMSALIEQKLAQDESFRVTVDNVSMVVRGTIFRISRGADESGKPTVTVQTVEGTVGVLSEDGAEQPLDEGLQDVVLLTDAGGTFAAVDEPIDYTALPQETLDWIRGALADKLGAATDPAEKQSLEDILALINALPPEAGATQTATPEATPTPIPTPTPTPEATYSLTLRESYFGTVFVKIGPYPAGAKIPVSVAPRHGYKFNGWMINGASAPALGRSSDIVFIMPGSDTMIAARFRKTKYRLSIDQPGLGGVISGKSGLYEKDEQVALSATASAGYQFTGWLVNGAYSAQLGATNPVTFLMPDSDQVICAQFRKTTYGLSIDQPGLGGIITGKSGRYEKDEQVTLSATASAGYQFTGWLVNGAYSAQLGTTNPVTFLMPDSDQVIGAQFALIPTHNLAFEQAAQGGGTISLPAGAYAAGATITVTIVPDANMKLACLMINGVADGSYAGQTSVSFVMPDTDVLICAVFEIG